MDDLKRRKCGPKVRTGCITCKVRRIKCGEEKPFCYRCTSTGRKCDGYLVTLQSLSRTTSRPAHGQATLLLGYAPASKGQSIITLFSDRTLYRVAGFFHLEPFWNRFVLQLSQNEPAISKAMAVLNMTHYQIEQTGDRQAVLTDKSIIQSYNEAIKSLAHRCVAMEREVYVPLAGCILFVCLEFLRGDMRAALNHIRGGWRVLQSYQRTNNSNSTSSSEDSSRSSSPPNQTSSEHELMTELSSIFERLNVHALLFQPLQSPDVDATASSHPQSFESLIFSTLAEAKTRSYELASEAMELVLSTSRLKYTFEAITIDHIINQVRLETQYQSWRQAFDQLCTSQQGIWTPQERKAANVVSIQNIGMQIWTSTCLSPEETIFDRFRPQFEQIVDLATENIGSGGQELSRSIGNFQFEMGMIPSLHFAGCKCRYPLLRRKVLKLLGSSCWREGLYDSYRSYRCIHIVMKMEELGLKPNRDHRGRESLAESLPVETARIHNAALGPVPLTEKEQALILMTKPDGVFNPMVKWETTVPTFGELPPLEHWFTWSP